MQRIHVIDSHTGSEPTRLVIDGGPNLSGSVAEQLRTLREQHDWLRRAVVNEPRGSDVMVGALLCEPGDPACTAGVIFFNNVGYLGMCGHGTIGLMASLAYLGRVQPGRHRIETPVGIISAILHPLPEIHSSPSRSKRSASSAHSTGADAAARANTSSRETEYASLVSVRNVPSYRHAHDIKIQVEGLGVVTGDVAWGGNWFFLINDHGQTIQLSNIPTLTNYATRVRDALARNGITGANGADVDHIELFGSSNIADSKNFVLCPGNAYDRSPCGTGTSAKLACLYADGKLSPGDIWRQESIVGSVFEGRIEVTDDGRVIPTITGEAFVTAEATLLLDPRDPFRCGVGGVAGVGGVRGRIFL